MSIQTRKLSEVREYIEANTTKKDTNLRGDYVSYDDRGRVLRVAGGGDPYKEYVEYIMYEGDVVHEWVVSFVGASTYYYSIMVSGKRVFDALYAVNGDFGVFQNLGLLGREERMVQLHCHINNLEVEGGFGDG